MNLVEALLKANERSREHLVDLDRVAKLIHGEGATVNDDTGLKMSANLTRTIIASTDQAIASGDVLAMLGAAKAHGLDVQEEDVEEASDA